MNFRTFLILKTLVYFILFSDLVLHVLLLAGALDVLLYKNCINYTLSRYRQQA